MSSIFFVGAPDVMDTPQSPAKSRMAAHRRSTTLSGVSPTSTSSTPLSISTSPSTTDNTLPQLFDTPSMPSHTRSMSHADIPKHNKRLSLHFPIQPGAGSPSSGISPRSRPQSWVAPPTPLTSAAALASPTEGNFLAVIAAQERRVLELKEELAKAEDDLKSLKEHWHSHEAIKKRNDIRKVTQLQPLNTALANHPNQDEGDINGSTLWLQKEVERRKALMTNTKTSQRGKVFSGSRHMRTLSLLSPENGTFTPSFPQPHDIREQDELTKRPQELARAATSPDIANHIAKTVTDDRYDLGGLPAIQREALLRTGKQMATDFKDGLLTFIEDIRQATVGDEAVIGVDGAGQIGVKGPSTRKVSDGRPALNRTTSSKKSAAGKSKDIADDFWKENGLAEPKSAPTKKKTPTVKNARTPQKKTQAQNTADDFEDNWDSWDTPNDKYMVKPASSSSSSSADESDESTSSGQSTTRTSISSADDASRDSKRNSLPWPDLVKLSPGNLKRTASHLMKEWEKNLTPPPESRDANYASGDYVGHSVSPGDLP